MVRQHLLPNRVLFLPTYSQTMELPLLLITPLFSEGRTLSPTPAAHRIFRAGSHSPQWISDDCSDTILSLCSSAQPAWPRILNGVSTARRPVQGNNTNFTTFTTVW